jgi:hypothetical protein
VPLPVRHASRGIRESLENRTFFRSLYGPFPFGGIFSVFFGRLDEGEGESSAVSPTQAKRRLEWGTQRLLPVWREEIRVRSGRDDKIGGRPTLAVVDGQSLTWSTRPVPILALLLGTFLPRYLSMTI